MLRDAPTEGLDGARVFALCRLQRTERIEGFDGRGCQRDRCIESPLRFVEPTEHAKRDAEVDETARILRVRREEALQQRLGVGGPTLAKAQGRKRSQGDRVHRFAAKDAFKECRGAGEVAGRFGAKRVGELRVALAARSARLHRGEDPRERPRSRGRSGPRGPAGRGASDRGEGLEVAAGRAVAPDGFRMMKR